MQLPLDRTSDQPLREQISAAIRERIESGEFAAGTRLPSSRELADRLGVNRTTVVQSFDDLRRDGFVESGVGRGTFVVERAAPRTAARAALRASSHARERSTRRRNGGHAIAANHENRENRE